MPKNKTQKIIIPKGTIDPNEDTLIEIPRALQEEAIVVAKGQIYQEKSLTLKSVSKTIENQADYKSQNVDRVQKGIVQDPGTSFNPRYASSFHDVKHLRLLSHMDVWHPRVDSAVVTLMKVVTEVTTDKNFDAKTTTSSEFEFAKVFAPYNEEDKKELGYTLLRHGVKYRKERKGQSIVFNLSSSRQVAVLFANQYTVTLSQAISATAEAVAREMSAKDDVSKIGANIGWKSLHKHFDKLDAYAKNKLELTDGIQKFYIPLVTLPRVRPCVLNKTMPNIGYMFLTFSMINDAYLMHINKLNEPSFTYSTAARLAMIDIQVNSSKLGKIVDKVSKICYKNMRHAADIDARIKDCLDLLKSALNTGDYKSVDVDAADY